MPRGLSGPAGFCVARPASSGTNTYVCQGDTVTVTDPAGKWKKYTLDAMGNLVQVTEQDPSLGQVQANYTYNLRSQLIQVSMPRGSTTQTRTFNYDLATGRLTSAANPENGTVSYTYNADGTVATKTDAKNQQVQYTYDSYRRVTQIRRYPVSGGQEDLCQRTNFVYDGGVNGWGRLTSTSWGGGSCTGGAWSQSYDYTQAGLVTTQTQNGGGFNLQASYTYNDEGAPVSTQYPSGLELTYTYDSMGRPTKLTDNQAIPTDYVREVQYNAAGQITQMNQFDNNGRYTETRQYNPLSQLARQTAVASGVTRMDYQYIYSATQNDGRITQRKDWVSGADSGRWELSFGADEDHRSEVIVARRAYGVLAGKT